VALLLGLDVGGDAGQLVGALLVLLATLCYAASTLVVKRSFAEVPMLGVVAVATAVATVLLAPAALALTPARLPGVQVVLALFALGVLCTAAALVLYFALIVEAGPSRAAVITYLNPAVAVSLGVAILGEPLTPAIVLGFLLIVAGSLLATQPSPRREASAPARRGP
jgi:drug/metabolite transporter (DMT)-like permease